MTKVIYVAREIYVSENHATNVSRINIFEARH